MKIFSTLFILITAISYGQVDEKAITKSIENSSNEYRTLFLSKKFEALSNHASPSLIKHLKTKQDFVYLLTELTKNVVSQGATVTDISFGKHSKIIIEENELQCTIPFTLKLEDEKQIVQFNSGLALISFDKGQNWYFTYKVVKDNLENNKILGLNENIIIPFKTQKIIPK